jgi:hypothetical protein
MEMGPAIWIANPTHREVIPMERTMTEMRNNDKGRAARVSSNFIRVDVRPEFDLAW